MREPRCFPESEDTEAHRGTSPNAECPEAKETDDDPRPAAYLVEHIWSKERRGPARPTAGACPLGVPAPLRRAPHRGRRGTRHRPPECSECPEGSPSRSRGGLLPCVTAIPEPSSPADALLRAGRFFTRRQVSPGQRAVFLEGAARVTSSTATAGATTRSVIGHVIGLLIPESWTSRAGLSEHAYHERAIALGTQLPRDRLTLVPARARRTPAPDPVRSPRPRPHVRRSPAAGRNAAHMPRAVLSGITLRTC
ncbi:respiratory nitrate reductase subunit gamma [Streptomyces collinus]|uniref:respiratory nitrate reductase subunit gamma n=1 Tax=Streptomyces collinus TaxID=42684 RepID=UPI0036995DEC